MFTPLAPPIESAGMHSAPSRGCSELTRKSASGGGSASGASDGSRTTTASGSSTESWRRIGRSSKRVYARCDAAPLGPVLGKCLDALALAQQRHGEELRLRSSRPGRRARASESPSWRPLQVFVDGARGELALAHGFHDGGAAVGGVAGRDTPRAPTLPRSAGQPGGGPSRRAGGRPAIRRGSSRGSLADRLDRRVGGNRSSRAGNRLGTASPTRVRLAELHARALDAVEPCPSRGSGRGTVSQAEPTPSERASLDLVRVRGISASVRR